MIIRFNIRYVVVFLLLLVVMMELHEIVHIVTGWLICGCWGPRDFNVWALCPGCETNHSFAWLATFTGPLFSFALMWLGMFWLRSVNPKMVMIGFALIFSNIPFGRITTVMMGGGDEMVVVRHFLKETTSRAAMIIIGTAIVLILGLPPLLGAFRKIRNPKAWLCFIGFLTLPLAFLLCYTLMGLNSLLALGFLSDPYFLGTPLLISLHTMAALAALIWLRKDLFLLQA